MAGFISEEKSQSLFKCAAKHCTGKNPAHLNLVFQQCDSKERGLYDFIQG